MDNNGDPHLVDKKLTDDILDEKKPTDDDGAGKGVSLSPRMIVTSLQLKTCAVVGDSSIVSQESLSWVSNNMVVNGETEKDGGKFKMILLCIL